MRTWLVLVVCLLGLHDPHRLHGLCALEHPHTNELSRAPEPLPLDMNHPQQAAINRLLMACSRGDEADLSWLASADPEWFLEPIGHSTDEGIMVHWSLMLNDALQRLDSERQQAALQILDQLYQADAASGYRAASFLPAPQARRDVRRFSNRLFDRGLPHRFLLAHHQNTSDSDLRHAVAQAQLRRADDPILGTAIPIPGQLQQLDSAPKLIDSSQGASVHWHRHQHLLLAQDAWGRTVWQYPLDQRVRDVITGPGGALVNTPHGVLLLDESGHRQDLRLPHSIDLLAIDGGAAWFSHGTTIYRLSLQDHSRLQFELPSPPRAAPLAIHNRSLWITDHELLMLSNDGTISHRLAHHLRSERLSLVRTAEGVAILSDNGVWAVTSPPTAAASLREQLEYHLHSDQYHAAITLWQEHDTPPALGSLALRAAIGAELDHSSAQTALTWDDTPQLQALLAIQMIHTTDPSQHGFWNEALQNLSSHHPTLQIPFTKLADPLLPRSAWPHHGQLAAWHSSSPPSELTFQAERAEAAIVLSAHSPDHELWWRHSIPSAGFHRPGLQLIHRNDRLLLIEGVIHITVLSAAHGQVLGKHVLPDLIPGELIAADHQILAWLSPVHQPTQLHIAQHPERRVITLQTPATHVRIADGQVVTSHTDGSEHVWRLTAP